MATELPPLSIGPLRHLVLPIPSPAEDAGWDELHRFQLHQAYQRSQLFGFTIRELAELGCWSQADAKNSDLPNGKTIPPPFLSRGSWQPGKVLIEDGTLGMWEMNNPIVWNALMPSLLLVSQWILSAHMETWIDGISLNEWQKVPANEVPDGFPKDHPGYQALFFEPRDGITVAQNIELQRKQIKNLKAYLRYKINIIPADGLPVGCLICGLHTADPATHKNRKYDVSTVTIDVQILRPLLRPDVTESERLVQQLLVAKTIMHETMHAFGKYTGTGNRVVLDGSEPFFRDEEISELGNSWENGTLGGVLQNLNKSIGNRSSMEFALGLASVDFPNYIQYGGWQWEEGLASRFRAFTKFGKGATYTYWPIQTQFCENMLQEFFWLHVMKFGSGALKPRRIIGRSLTKGGSKVSTLSEGREFKRAYQMYGNEGIFYESDYPMDGDDVERWRTDEEVRFMAIVKLFALQRQHVEMEEKKRRAEELANPGSKAAAQEKHKRDDSVALQDEEKVLDRAFRKYRPYQFDDTANLYGQLAKSKFPRVRAECLLCMAAMCGGLNPRADAATLLVEGNMELLLLDADDPFIQVTINDVQKRAATIAEAKLNDDKRVKD